MSRRSVVLVICLAAVMVVASVMQSDASPARVAGLNLNGAATGFVRDYVNTYPYPVAITRYPNMMWAHLGERGSLMEADHRVMGMFHELGEDGAYGILGVTLRENSPMDPLLQYMGLAGASHQQFDLIYGRDMEQASFGLRFDMARSSYEDSDGNVTSPDEPGPIGLEPGGYVNTWGLGAGVDVDLNENCMLEVGGEVRMYGFKDDATEMSDDGSISMRLNARIFHEWTENKTLVPLVSYSRTQIGQENGGTLTWSMNDFFAGAAINHTVNGEDLLIYGAALRMGSMKHENDEVTLDESMRSVPILFMAAEHRFKSWLVGRGGASQAMVSSKTGSDDPDPDQKWLESEFNFALGLGAEWSHFVIDATLNQNFPFTGPDFIAGTPTGQLFGQVSFTYTYD